MIESITEIPGMAWVRKTSKALRELLPAEAVSIPPLGVNEVYCLSSHHEAVHEVLHMDNIFTIIQVAYRLGVLAGRQEGKKGDSI